MVRAFLKWIPFAIAVTGVIGLLYATVQQNYRQSLNDPQIQMAEDGAAALARGAVPADVVPRGVNINADESLAPFIAVYDSAGMPLEASATIGGKPPLPPIGIFMAARENHGKDTDVSGENRVSWQPSHTTRIALVVKYVPEKQQLVAAGRNMREVEMREENLFRMIELGWLVIMVSTLAGVWAVSKL